MVMTLILCSGNSLMFCSVPLPRTSRELSSWYVVDIMTDDNSIVPLFIHFCCIGEY